MKKRDRKKIKKFFRDFKSEIEDLKLTKHHFYYTALCLIIILLSIFLFNNYNNCRMYEINAGKDDFEINNGLLIVSAGNNILQINNIEYNGNIDSVMSLKTELYVLIKGEEYKIDSFERTGDGFNIIECLSERRFIINETKYNESVLTKKILNNIEDNLYLRITYYTEDSTKYETNINLSLDNIYSSNKLFY